MPVPEACWPGRPAPISKRSNQNKLSQENPLLLLMLFFVVKVVGWLVGWLAGWLVGCFSFVCWFVFCFVLFCFLRGGGVAGFFYYYLFCGFIMLCCVLFWSWDGVFCWFWGGFFWRRGGGGGPAVAAGICMSLRRCKLRNSRQDDASNEQRNTRFRLWLRDYLTG